MSLDFYLDCTEVLVCECGRRHVVKTVCVFDTNITHNLASMFAAVGCYETLWRGDGRTAADALLTLEPGLADMEARPSYYQTFDAPNGWGLYVHALPWLKRVVTACREYPTAVLRCSR